MNVSSTIALTRELKPSEASFLSTDDLRFLWPKYKFLEYFEDWLITVEVRLKSLRNKKCLHLHKYMKDIKIIVHTFTELAYKVVHYVLAERFIQNPLETYFYKQHPPGA